MRATEILCRSVLWIVQAVYYCPGCYLRHSLSPLRIIFTILYLILLIGTQHTGIHFTVFNQVTEQFLTSLRYNTTTRKKFYTYYNS